MVTTLRKAAFHSTKNLQVSKWRMMARASAETLETRGTWAARRREELQLGPGSAQELEALKTEVLPTFTSLAFLEF